MAGTGTSRDDWITAAMTLLARGASPAETGVGDLCAVMPRPLTRGSFNWHFRDGRLAALHREVISRWLAQRTAACDEVRSVREPDGRLRILRAAAAAHGPGDSAMRRWAAAPPAAGPAGRDVHRQLTAALARLDKTITAHLDAAFVDMGFSGPEAAVLAATLAAAFAAAGPAGPAAPAAPAGFEVLLAVLRLAAAARPAPEVQVLDGDDGEVLLVLAARGAPPGQLDELRRAARQFLAGAGQ